MTHSLTDTLAGVGNSNYVPGFIRYFERQIESQGEASKSLADAPNYFAWLHIASEFACYAVKECLFLRTQGGDSGVFNKQYKAIVDQLFQIPEVTQQTKDDILLFVRIRHLLVHKGFPNPHDVPASDERPLAIGIVYSEDEVRDLSRRLQSPAEYSDLKGSFTRLMRNLSALRGPVTFNTNSE